MIKVKEPPKIILIILSLPQNTLAVQVRANLLLDDVDLFFEKPFYAEVVQQREVALVLEEIVVIVKALRDLISVGVDFELEKLIFVSHYYIYT